MSRVFRGRSSGTARSESRIGFCEDLHKLFFRGINVLDNKSELEKALTKHRTTLEQKLKEAEKTTGSELEKLLAERAQRLLKVSLVRHRPFYYIP